MSPIASTPPACPSARRACSTSARRRQLTVAGDDRQGRVPARRAGEAQLHASTTPAASPSPGALSLAAVDEAVFSVLEQAPGMEQTFYTLEQELLQPVYAIYPWSPDAPLHRPAGRPAAVRAGAVRPHRHGATPRSRSAGDGGHSPWRRRWCSPNQHAGTAARTALAALADGLQLPGEGPRRRHDAAATAWTASPSAGSLLVAALALTRLRAPCGPFVRWQWVLVRACRGAVPVGSMLLTFVALLGGKAGSSVRHESPAAMRMEEPMAGEHRRRQPCSSEDAGRRRADGGQRPRPRATSPRRCSGGRR